MPILLMSLHTLAVWTLEASLAACLLIPLIRLAQYALGRTWPARWHAALWLLLLLRLALPLPHLGPAVVSDLRPHGNQTWTQVPISAPLTQRVPREILPQPIFRDRSLLALQLYWVTGALLVLGIAAFRLRRLQRQVQGARVITSGPAWARLEALRAQLALPRPVLLLESDQIATPAVVGLGHPRILLPVGLAQGDSPAALDHVLAHELMHLKRRDTGLGLLMVILQALHWFNPLVWYAFHRLRQDRELACDEAVVTTFGTDIQAYGETLLAFTRTRPDHRCLPGSLGLGTRVPLIRRRIQALTGLMEGRIAPTWPRFATLVFTGLVGLTLWGGLTPRVSWRGMPSLPLGAFVEDPALHGHWTTVDFVPSPEAFHPGRRHWRFGLWFSALDVEPGGQAEASLGAEVQQSWQWTRGAFQQFSRVPAPYEIREIAGQKVLFVSWMSGDVTRWGMTPSYYVLVQK